MHQKNVDRHKTIITDDGREIPLYNQEWTNNHLEFACPPTDRKGLLSSAWITMQPGIYSPYGKATPEGVAQYLRSCGISGDAAIWAANIAEKYYNKKDFIKFMEELEKCKLNQEVKAQ